MKHFFKQILLSVLLISLAIPASLMLYPQVTKAQSASTCLSYYLGKKAAGMIGSVVGVNAVPVDSRTANKKLSDLDAQSQTQNFQDCVVYPLVKILAKTLLQKFTSDIVQWINGGFQGSPGFVTNPEGFFAEVGDRAAGSIIQQIAPALCGPFSLKLRIALGGHYSSYDEIGCKLSDVQKNVYNAFTGGNFNAGGRGWQNWVSITQNPSNNILGSYLQVINYTDSQVAKKVQAKDKEISWANGFLSTRDCLGYEQVPNDPGEYSADPESYALDTNNAGFSQGRCLAYGPVKTPGSTIEASLNSTLAQPLQDIGLAKSIDDILGALVGQAINQVFNATGLISNSNSNYSSGNYTSYNSYTYSGQTTYSQLFDSNNYSETGPVLPIGINPNICSTFGSTETYNLVGGVVKVTTVNGQNAVTQNALKTDGSLWTTFDLNRVTQYCQAAPLNTFVTGVVNNLASTTNSDQLTTQPEDVVTNLAFGEPASQIRDFSGEFTANQAVDGSSYTNGSYAPASITASQQNPWWQVTLPQVSRIDEIRIYRRAEAGVNYFDALGTFAVSVYDSSQNVVWASPNIETSDSSPIPYVVPVNQIGKYVRIQRVDGTHSLQLAEVMVMGSKNPNSTAPNNNPGNGQPLEPFNLSIVPPISDSFNLTSNSGWTTSFTVAGNSEKQGIAIKLKLQKEVGPDSFVDYQMSSLLSSLTLSIKDLTTGTVINRPNGGVLPNLVPLSGGTNSVTEEIDFRILNARHYNFGLQFVAVPMISLPCIDGHYRLITEIDAGNGNIWTQTAVIQVPDYNYTINNAAFGSQFNIFNPNNVGHCNAGY